jgi:LCT (Lysosomal Cystine Transporter) family transporter
MINISRKSVSGLSTDASIMQLLNFASYAAYCSFFFFDEGIRQEYRNRHGQSSEIMVSSSDVAFSLHAFLLTLVIIFQIAYYGGYKARPINFATRYVALSILLMCATYSFCVLLRIPGFLWIDFLYMLAMVKLVLTIATYIPQLVLNFQRKSTTGFNIWNIILDFSGGGLSLLQLILDGYDLGDIAGAVQGNWAKCLLSLISLCFDSIFFFQHFFLYKKRSVTSDATGDLSDRIRMV